MKKTIHDSKKKTEEEEMLREKKEELEWCAVKDFFSPLQYSSWAAFWSARSVGPSIRFSSYMDFFSRISFLINFFIFTFFSFLVFFPHTTEPERTKKPIHDLFYTFFFEKSFYFPCRLSCLNLTSSPSK